ncbi:hypothetical protein H5410_004221 [Solanum commersonii]|uniref:Uncharacterized protein n=1 Tax=Solanum commersonii TaxID=4109 RepID=A0A9J6B742_SOLCO|nr:hypothetical protein H5410_004221 [Solanum commersonii]
MKAAIRISSHQQLKNLIYLFGILPSWGLSQKLSLIIGPSRAREVSLTAIPINAEQAERWGLVNYVVDRSELLNKARQIAEAIIKNNQDLVLRYKAVINDGFKHDLTRALALEKVDKTVGIGGVIRNHTGDWVTSFSNKNHVKPPYDSIISECRSPLKKLQNPVSSVFFSRDVVFKEGVFPFKDLKSHNEGPYPLFLPFTDHIDDASTQDPCLNDDLQISDLCPSVDSLAHVIQEMPLVNVEGELMKEVSKGTLDEKVGEETKKTMMKEEETQVDAKNPQKAEVDTNFSSAEGTVGEETMKEGTKVDIDFPSTKDKMAEKMEWRQRTRLRMWIQII